MPQYWWEVRRAKNRVVYQVALCAKCFRVLSVYPAHGLDRFCFIRCHPSADCSVIHWKVELTTAAGGMTTVLQDNARSCLLYSHSEGPFRVWWDVPTF
jgi:hypothetical protein